MENKMGVLINKVVPVLAISALIMVPLYAADDSDKKSVTKSEKKSDMPPPPPGPVPLFSCGASGLSWPRPAAEPPLQ